MLIKIHKAFVVSFKKENSCPDEFWTFLLWMSICDIIRKTLFVKKSRGVSLWKIHIVGFTLNCSHKLWMEKHLE
jgi:hypothetical protein